MKVSARGLNINFQYEVPIGTSNGILTTFTLSQLPYSSASVIVFLDGLAQPPTNFSISGTTITFTLAPTTGSDVLAHYFRSI